MTALRGAAILPRLTCGAAALLLGLVLTSCSHPLPPPVTSAPADRVVVCHYMTWFRWAREAGGLGQDHWSWHDDHVQHDPTQVREGNKRDVCSVYVPRISTYDSRDPDVLDYHLLSAKAAGIQAFVVDWYGAGGFVDQSLHVLFERAELLGMQVGVCLEEKTWFPGWEHATTRAEAVAGAIRQAEYVLQEYGTRRGCWRLDGRPVLLVFNGSGDWPDHGKKLLTAEEWAQLDAAVTAKGGLLVRMNFDASYPSARTVFAWCGDEAYLDWYHRTGDAWLKEGKIDSYFSAACPGFDDRGTWGWGNGVRFDDRKDGATYADYWRRAAASKARAVQVVTWNDFAEGTVIEPTAEFGTQYLDRTETGVQAYNGRPVDLTDNDLAYQWYVLTKRVGAAYRRQLAAVRTDLAAGRTARARQALDQVAKGAGITIPPYVGVTNEAAPFSPDPAYAAAYTAALAVITATGNLVTPERVRASSTEAPTRTAAQAADRRTDTRWASEAADEQWLQVDLPGPVSSGRLATVWEAAYAKSWTVEVSADGSTWQEVATRSANAPSAEVVAIKAAAPFTHLRLHLLTRGTKYGFSLWDVGFVAE